MANIIRVGGGAGGGGLDITVVGGTTQPASPKENTIWVNTDAEIGAVTLAPNAPASPEVGDVWVNTTNKYNSNGTNASTNLIRVNDNPYLEINVLNISQWDGSAWVTRDGSAIYANGGWTTMALYMLNFGVVREGFTLTGAHNTTSGGNMSTTSDVIYDFSLGYASIQLTSKTAFEIGMQFSPMVDITNYTKLRATGQIYHSYSSVVNTVYVGCSTSLMLTTRLANITTKGVATQTISGSGFNDFDVTADLTTWDGENYVAVGMVTNNHNSTYPKYLKLQVVVLTA